MISVLVALDIVEGASAVGATTTLTATDLANIWNYEIDGSRTAKEILMAVMAACTGNASGLNPDAGNVVYKDPGGTIDRITAKTDRFGNRSDVDLDFTE